MIFKKLYNIKKVFNKIYKTVPGNKYERDALFFMLKLSLIFILISTASLLSSLYINKNFIYILIFLYPTIETCVSSIPIILQEPGQPNRFNAPTVIFVRYILITFLTLIITIILMYLSHELTLIYYLGAYLLSIYRLIHKILSYS